MHSHSWLAVCICSIPRRVYPIWTPEADLAPLTEDAHVMDKRLTPRFQPFALHSRKRARSCRHWLAELPPPGFSSCTTLGIHMHRIFAAPRLSRRGGCQPCETTAAASSTVSHSAPRGPLPGRQALISGGDASRVTPRAHHLAVTSHPSPGKFGSAAGDTLGTPFAPSRPIVWYHR
jgi:hypothetical protein